MSTSTVSRRNFVSGAAATALGAGMIAGAQVALADEASNVPVAANGLPVKYTTDILIIGGGQAGFSAGIQALDLGVENVMIIDKVSGEGDDFAGSSLRCGGTFLTPADDTDEAREAYVNALWEYGEGHTNRDLFVPVAERCHSIAQHHGLTERETEVLVLLCRGRGKAYIAETLSVSENTVRHHCKNIYAKLQVHTREELMDLIGVL